MSVVSWYMLKALRLPFTISGTASDRKDHAKQNSVLRALRVLRAWLRDVFLKERINFQGQCECATH
jgi:hypothetical protein